MNDNVTSTEVDIEYWTDKERAEYIVALKIEIEVLKARLDECHRTIKELIQSKPSST